MPARLRPTRPLLAFVLLAAACADGAAPPAPAAPLAGVPSTWFVELAEPGLALGGKADLQQDEEAGFLGAAETFGVDLELRFRFRTIVNGMSVRIDPAALAELAALPGVVRLVPVGTTEMPELDAASEPELASALAMTGADVVQSELGFDGRGVRIGIIDSGIDLQHPDLAASVVTGFDFVGDAYDANDPDSRPVVEPGEGTRPGGDDCGGHGTHVAGIAAAHGDPAAGGARGVAPGAELGAYRIFGCAGSTGDDVIVAALERAFGDGMDVVNLSLGSNNGWADDFLSLGLSRVLELGMIPVATAGNNGASGAYTIGSPGAGDDVVTVASFDNQFTMASKLLLADGTAAGYTALTGAPPPPTEGASAPIAYVGQGCDADAYAADPHGKVALVTRGTCNFAEKYQRAFREGAVGVLIENNRPGGFGGTLGGTFDLGFGVTISQAAGATLRAAIDAGGDAVTITWTDGFVTEPVPTGNLISSFSSYGPTPTLGFKPEIGAPGGLIRSTWPLDKPDSTGYAVLSGTSMAAPHVTGAIALLLHGRPDLAPHQVRTALQNAAQPRLWFQDPASGALEATQRQGAGMLRIDRAIRGTTFVSPGRLALGESERGPRDAVLVIANRTDAAVTYRLAHAAAMATTGPTNAPTFAAGAATVRFVRNGQTTPIETVTVAARGHATITATITAPEALPDGAVYGGYLTFTPEGTTPATDASVPYLGFKGDYQALPALASAPVVVRLDAAGAPVDQPEGAVFTMAAGDAPAFAIGFAQGIERLFVEAVPLALGATPRRLLELGHVRRHNPGKRSTFGIEDLDLGALPDGAYRFRIHLVKAGGELGNPAHVEIAETPRFVIDRP